MQNLVSSKVFWGMILTTVIGALTAVSAVSPTWGGVITAFAGLLTAIGHTSNVLKGVR